MIESKVQLAAESFREIRHENRDEWGRVVREAQFAWAHHQISGNSGVRNAGTEGGRLGRCYKKR